MSTLKCKLAEYNDKRKKKNVTIIVVASVLFVVLSIIIYIKILDPLFKYNKAEKLFENGQYLEACEIFESLGEFGDSFELVKQSQYKYATQLMNNGLYEEAISVFSALGEYEDSQSRISECEIGIISSLIDDEEYEQAIEWYDQSDKDENISRYIYDDALELIRENQIDNGIMLLRSLGDYEDCSDRIVALALEHREYLEEGMIYPLGEYNGEIIEWYVVSVEDDRALLLSRYVLEQRRFDANPGGWDTSEIREWLNGEFYETSFSENEKELIIESFDNVFLLSTSEFLSLPNEIRSCTDRAGVQHLWWLRSPGSHSRNAGFVDLSGNVLKNGFVVNYHNSSNLGVRPAIWISLE